MGKAERPSCPVHPAAKLICPACQGAIGGATMTPRRLAHLRRLGKKRRGKPRGGSISALGLAMILSGCATGQTAQAPQATRWNCFNDVAGVQAASVAAGPEAAERCRKWREGGAWLAPLEKAIDFADEAGKAFGGR